MEDERQLFITPAEDAPVTETEKDGTVAPGDGAETPDAKGVLESEPEAPDARDTLEGALEEISATDTLEGEPEQTAAGFTADGDNPTGDASNAEPPQETAETEPFFDGGFAGEENTPAEDETESITLFDDPDIEEIPIRALIRKRKREKQAAKEEAWGILSRLKHPKRLVAILLICIAVTVAALLIIPAVSRKDFSPKAEVSAEGLDTANGENTVTGVSTDNAAETESSTGEETAVAAQGLTVPTPHPLSDIGQEGTNGRFLSLNDNYPIVAEIQQRLYELNYMDIPVVDGVKGFTTSYGPATKAAVKAFQAVNGIDVDGMLGVDTYDLLMSESALPLMFDNSCSDSVFESYINKLQTRLIELGFLEGKVSGKFADKTKAALKAFQQMNGLDPDGVAGPMTLEILYGDSALNSKGIAVPYVTEETAAEITATPTPAPTEEPATGESYQPDGTGAITEAAQ